MVCGSPVCGFAVRTSTQPARLSSRLTGVLTYAILTSRARAMQPATAVDTLAPSPSTAKTPANTIERHVGELIAAAGLVIVEALDERANGGLTPRARR